MKIIRNEFIQGFYDLGQLSLSDAQFEQCRFEHCELAALREGYSSRTQIRNVLLSGCRVDHCGCGPALFEDVAVENLSTGGDLLILWGPIFRRVRFSGIIGSIKINRQVGVSRLAKSLQQKYDEERVRFYDEAAEWALDIRDAAFTEFDVVGIPASLILRNPSSQFVVTRTSALEPGWRAKVSKNNSFWPFVLDMFLSDGDSDRVLVAPQRSSRARRQLLLDQLNELRDFGVLH